MAWRQGLQWPEGRPRTNPQHQKPGPFRAAGSATPWKSGANLTISAAVERLERELNRMGVAREDAVISANLKIAAAGVPYSKQAQPGDPGVGLFLQWGGRAYSFACDRYDTVEQNVAALAAHIEATRAIERWGCATAEEAFRGYESLPPPAAAEVRTCWTILGIREHASIKEITEAFREKLMKAHPDRGGSDEAVIELTDARAEALSKARA